VIALPDQPAALMDLLVDTPLGISRPRSPRRTTTAELPPGALLLSYTDGLVERRHQIIDVGLKTLIDVVTPDNPSAPRRCPISAPNNPSTTLRYSPYADKVSGALARRTTKIAHQLVVHGRCHCGFADRFDLHQPDQEIFT
jgi:hypothetical protein